ncbi:MAG: hypothetical protein FWF80_02880, partial [Defluviitaleaceae bacterium]|nr:hypothetical protein [Defluviitaleaceae bacterium]
SGGGIAGGGNSSGGGIGGGPSHSNANTAPPPLPRSSRIPEANDIIIIHDEPVPQTDFSVLEVEYEVEHEAQTITIEGTDAQATHFRYDMDANDHIAFATIEDTPQMPQTGLENTMGLLTAGLILSIFSAAVIGGFIRKLRL